MAPDPKRCRPNSLLGQAAILSGVMLLLAAIVGGIAWRRHGGEMAGAAAITAAVCYFSALVALICERAFSGNGAIAGILLSISIRTGVPLAAVLCMKKWGGRFAEPEAVVYLIVFYFAALITHVVLSCRASHASPFDAIRDFSAK